MVIDGEHVHFSDLEKPEIKPDNSKAKAEAAFWTNMKQ